MDTRLQDFQEQIGRNISAARESRGQSLRGLAAAIDIHPGTLSKIEAGKMGASIKMLISVADALEMPLFQLMMEEDAARAIHMLTRGRQVPQRDERTSKK